MILFLPPAPHTGAFFDTVRASLAGLKTSAGTYPGYGDVPSLGTGVPPSIGAYAESLQPKDDIDIAAFHTGCLVAMEMALQSSKVGRLLLIDIPYFDEATKTRHRSGLDPDNPEHDAFRAAFDYDAAAAFEALSQPVTCVATDSSLFEPTIKAAQLIENAALIERRDITKPAFEGEAMAALIRDWAA